MPLRKTLEATIDTGAARRRPGHRNYDNANAVLDALDELGISVQR
jgi:hypothetical protein